MVSKKGSKSISTFICCTYSVRAKQNSFNRICIRRGQVFQPDSSGPRFSRRYTTLMEGREWKKPSESGLVSFSAKKLDGKGAREWMKKKERKGKRAMKPRRKNGINSLPFFFETRTSKCRVGQKKYSDLYCLKILFDKSAKIFIITYGFINFLLTQFSKRLHESKIQISSGRKKVQRKWRGRGTKRRIIRWTKMTKHRLS